MEDPLAQDPRASCGRARRRAPLSGLPAVLLAVGLYTACSGGERRITDPPDGGGPPASQDMVVDAELDGSGSDLAASLGWETGVPGADVHVLRNGESVWQTFASGDDGRVAISGLLPGLYRVYGSRRLDGSESQQTGSVRAFGDGGTVPFPSVDRVDLELYPDEGAGLVISELNGVVPPPWETGGGSYHGSQYVEVYNNSSQTLFLDGMLFGRAYFFGQRDFSFNPCSQSQATREDPEGIYTREILAFPGSGSSFPIGPGETRLIALVAIDHTPVHPWLFDLSEADFEIAPVGAADNPDVPNMINVGEEPWRDSPSALNLGGFTHYLSQPVDVESLPILLRDHTGRGYVRLPASAFLDAVSIAVIRPDKNLEIPPCEPMIHQRFDRYEIAREVSGEGVASQNLSYQRVVLREEGARTILQNTNTTAADFARAAQTPGTIMP